MKTTIASFEVTYTQYLNEQGKILSALPTFAQDKAHLLKLYKQMVLTRVFDTKAIALQRTGKMGTYASTLGQEAIGTAIGDAMLQDDVFIPYYRDYSTQLQRGVTMAEIYRYWGGDERGSCFANNQNDFPISVPIASQYLHAAGVGYAIKYRNQKQVVVVTGGDGATSEGDFYEAMNAAGVWQLPVVFIVNNNQWAISVPRSQQTASQTIAQKAIAAGFTGEQVDGNDVIAIREVCEQAIDKARKGNGPTLIEAITYRLCDHTTADDASRYRPQAEFDAARPRDPIARLQHYLVSQGFWDDTAEQQWVAHCQQQVQQAADEYLQTPPQPIEAMFDYMYAKWPDALAQQRQSVLEEANNG